MTTTSTPIATQNLLHSVNFIRSWMNQLVDTLSDEQLMHQPVANGNHALWIVGHSAWCDDEFMKNLGDTQATSPPEWKELFGNGSTPSSNAADYPPIAELKSALERNRTALVQWIEGMDDAKLAEALPEEWHGFAPTYGAFIAVLAAHEGMHVGQMTMIRKSLGMAPLMA